MSTTHGLVFGFERFNEDRLLIFKATGKLTHADYEFITPMLKQGLQGAPKNSVKALFDITDFEGWELHAAWDDFKLGLEHGAQFQKIALYGEHKWQGVAAKVGGWFVRGEVKSFDHKQDAIDWLQT